MTSSPSAKRPSTFILLFPPRHSLYAPNGRINARNGMIYITTTVGSKGLKNSGVKTMTNNVLWRKNLTSLIAFSMVKSIFIF
jgi:hypothetical protein